MSLNVALGHADIKRKRYSRIPEQPRCTTCGAPMRRVSGHGHVPDRWACSASYYHPRTDNHPHQLRELRALPIRTARLEALVGLVEDNLGVLAGEVVA